MKHKNLLTSALFFLTGIVLLGFGRASSWSLLAPLAAVGGYACMFAGMRFKPGLLPISQGAASLDKPSEIPCVLPRELPLAATQGVSSGSPKIAAPGDIGNNPGFRGWGPGWVAYFIAMLLQSSWLLSHPFSYIYAAWIALSALFAIPYALLSLLVVRTPQLTLLSSAGLAAAFTLLEVGFCSLPCGYSFQSAALHLSWNPYALQLASLCGAIGLSFLVFWANILVFASRRALIGPTILICALPYLGGGWLYWHKAEEQRAFDAQNSPINVAVCHMEEPPDVYARALPPEQLHEQEWHKIFKLVAQLKPGQVDLVVLPEGAVPFAAHSPLFLSSHLPQLWHAQLASSHHLLSSIDLSEILAAHLQSPLIVGLEGRGICATGQYASYNSCFFVSPESVKRYDKQLLLPLGEYIPTPLLRSYLAAYGIHNSFTPGETCVMFERGSLRICPLICYEETFASYAQEAARLRPNLIVSLSNDCWFPDVRWDHCELARLRAVEIGTPLVRSCNQGISIAIDALGRTIASRGDSLEKSSGCVIAPLSLYTAPSVFAALGTHFFVGGLVCIACIAGVCKLGVGRWGAAEDRQ